MCTTAITNVANIDKNLHLQSLDAHTQASDGHPKPLYGHQKPANGDFCPAKIQLQEGQKQISGHLFFFLPGSQGFPALSRGAKRCGWRAIKALWLTLFYVLKEV